MSNASAISNANATSNANSISTAEAMDLVESYYSSLEAADTQNAKFITDTYPHLLINSNKALAAAVRSGDAVTVAWLCARLGISVMHPGHHTATLMDKVIETVRNIATTAIEKGETGRAEDLLHGVLTYIADNS